MFKSPFAVLFNINRIKNESGEITYKTFLGGRKLQIFPHTKSFKHTRTWLFFIKWAKTRALDSMKVLTYDYKEKRSTDEDGYERVSGVFLIGYRLKNDAERTVFRLTSQQHSYDLIGMLKRDLGKSIDRKKYL